MKAILFAGSALLLCAPIASAGHQDVHRARVPSWVAPGRADAMTNPVANRPDATAGGTRLFQERCSACHGDDARGTPHGPDLAKVGVQSQSDGALFWKISSGNTRTGMPTFSFLPPAQRWQLVLHLRALPRS
jgi:mono/diheme cytochrome c family protein